MPGDIGLCNQDVWRHKRLPDIMYFYIRMRGTTNFENQRAWQDNQIIFMP